MRILHLMLSCFYIDDGNYQENILPLLNKEDGHDVKIIASTETFVQNNLLGYTEPRSYTTKDGIPIVRLPYKASIGGNFFSRKIRKYKDLYEQIKDFSPDIIFFHGSAAHAILTAAKYKKKHPNVKLFADSHEDYNNSARNFISKNVLHRHFYKRYLKKALPYIDKVFYITKETKNFLSEFYKVPDSKLDFLPLGGLISDEKVRSDVRKKVRKQLGLSNNDILCVHSGKMDKFKKTADIVNAFTRVPDSRLRLIIIGSMDTDVKAAVEAGINADKRIEYLGWKTKGELLSYLYAGDLYIQPGGQSVTMQNALCAGCTAALYPYESHKFLLGDNVFYIENEADIENLLVRIVSDNSTLKNMKERSFTLAKNVLDYKKIVKKMYE